MTQVALAQVRLLTAGYLDSSEATYDFTVSAGDAGVAVDQHEVAIALPPDRVDGADRNASRVAAGAVPTDAERRFAVDGEEVQAGPWPGQGVRDIGEAARAGTAL